MSSLSVDVRPQSVLKNPVQESATLQRHVRALVVSPNIELRRPLLRTLEALSTDVIVCSTRTQAEEVLSSQTVDVVFCDEQLPDGSYEELIHSNHCDNRIPRVVVGENQTFVGEEGLLKSRGVSVDVLQDSECIQLMREFIKANPGLWNEDTGE